MRMMVAAGCWAAAWNSFRDVPEPDADATSALYASGAEAELAAITVPSWIAKVTKLPVLGIRGMLCSSCKE